MPHTELRPVTIEELPQLGELLDGIFRRPRGIFDQHQLTDFPRVFSADNLRNGRGLFVEGQLVSHAAVWPRQFVVNGRQLKVGVLVSVATHVEHRKRGYAERLVSSLQQQLREERYDLGVLWTAVPAFYERLGWRRIEVGGVRARIETPLVEPSLTIEPLRVADHAEAVQTLHRQSARYCLRSADDWRQLLQLPKIDYWVALRDAKVVAYLVAGRAVNKKGIIEYGGEAAGIVALAGHASRVAGQLQPLPWLLYPDQAELIEWCRRQSLVLDPLHSSKGFGGEMILPLNEPCWSPEVQRNWYVWGLDHA